MLLHSKIVTNVVSPLELLLRNPEAPTIVSPSIASPHPVMCLFSTTILTRMREKMAVVTMDAPLNIMYVEPEMKASPMYCSIDEKASEHAGIMKMNLECGVLPSSSVSLVF